MIEDGAPWAEFLGLQKALGGEGGEGGWRYFDGGTWGRRHSEMKFRAPSESSKIVTLKTVSRFSSSSSGRIE